MTVFFLFFAVGFGVFNLLAERHDGTLRRLLAAPIARSSIIGGKLLTSILAGMICGAILVVATTMAIDGVEWGDPVGVGLLLIAYVVAAAGIVALVTSLARTAQQAQIISTQVGTVLGILGGAFFPVSLGGWLDRLQVVSPHRWFMRGIEDLGTGELSAIVLPMVVLLAIGIMTCALALGGLGRRLQP